MDITNDIRQSDMAQATEIMYGPYKYDGQSLLRHVKSAIKGFDAFAHQPSGAVMSDKHIAVHAVTEWLGLMNIDGLVAAVRAECPDCGIPGCACEAEMGDPRDTSIDYVRLGMAVPR